MRIRCPHCKIALKLKKPPGSGSLKCPDCGKKFRVKPPSAKQPSAAPPPQEAGFDEFDDFGSDYDDFAPAPRSRNTRGKSPRKGGRKPQTSGGNKGLILGLCIGGGGIVVALIIMVLVLSRRSSSSEAGDKVASNNPPAQAPGDGGSTPPGGNPPANKPPVLKTPVVEPAAKDPPLTPIKTPPSSGNEQLKPEVLARVKKATVMLRVTSSNGTRATGSGFFAVNSNLVITNAHVVDMLKPGSRPPRSIAVVVDSGEPTEKSYPAGIMAVDRTSDLAMVRVVARASAKAPLPKPLEVFSAAKLLETQVVYVFGFPFGEKLGKNITISKSSVSSLRKGRQGNLKQVQVNGGMHPGNSGGPVVDAGGHVVGVAVSGIPGTQVNFAIPGDSLYRMIEGRISGLSLGDTKQKNRKFLLPVTVRFIDPLVRVKAVKVAWWFGKPGKSRQPSTSKPALQPGDANHTVVACRYRNTLANCTLEIPEVPAGKTVHIQPIYETRNRGTNWAQSITYDPGPLLEETAVTLARRYRPGKFDVHLNTKSTFQISLFEGEELTFLSHIDAPLTENVYSVPRQGNVGKQFTVRKGFQWGVSVNNRGVALPGAREAFRSLGGLSMIVAEDRAGNLVSRRTDLSRVPRSGQSLLGTLGDQMTESLDLVSVPLPNKVTAPGTTWQAKRLVPVDTYSARQTGSVAMTYTYKGVGDYKGHRVAVISYRGTLRGRSRRGTTIAGAARGKAYFDLRDKRFIYSRAYIDVNLIMPIGRDTATASGQMRVWFSRLKPDSKKR